MSPFRCQRLSGLCAVYLPVIAVAAALVGCGSTAPLRVATSGDYPPFSVTTPYGAIVGFDSDVATQFSSDYGREMVFVRLQWPRLVEQADAGAFDVAMSGVTVRADRIPHMLFSRPYALTGAVVAVRRERADEFRTLEQIDRPGVRIVVNRGGHLERVARARFVQATILTADDNRILADRVLRDEVDAAVSDDLEVGTWPVETFAVVGPFTRDRKAYAVPPGQTKLLSALNAWLAARERDGWLNVQRRHWLPGAAWTADQACFEAIATAIDLRLLLMPQVAVAKSQQNLPIEDPVQEQKVLAQVAAWAVDEGVDPEFAVALFENLIVAAKAIQSTVDARGTLVESADLGTLRRAIGFYSRSLVNELGRCQFSLDRSDAQSRLEAALRNGESFQDGQASLAADLAALLTHPRQAIATTRSAAAEPRAEGAATSGSAASYVDFCIPPHLRFDLEGYSVEEISGGQLLDSTPRRELRSGSTRVPVSPGRHEYEIYVNGSSADPRREADAAVMPSTIAVDVPAGRVVTVYFAPSFSASGAFELHWQDVYGAAAGGLETYRGLTRFDVEVTVSAATSTDDATACPW